MGGGFAGHFEITGINLNGCKETAPNKRMLPNPDHQNACSGDDATVAKP